MSKRFRIKDFIAGPAAKEFNADILSGTQQELLSGNPANLWSDLYVAGISGNILTDTYTVVDATIYNAGWFERKYSERNPDLIPGATSLDMKPTESDIIDAVQFGDYAFLLTNATTMGTQYNRTTKYDTDDTTWFREPHRIVTYVAGTSGDEIDIVCSGMTFNIVAESPDIVFGYLAGSTVYLYVKDLSGSVLDSTTVYSLSAGIPGNLPFNYLLEQPLRYPLSFARDGIVYGEIATSVVYTLSASLTGTQFLYSPYADDDSENKMYVNPFKLKNMYDNNWESRINHDSHNLDGARDYLKVGKTQETLWLSYKYYTETPTIVQDFQLVERVKGLYKYRPVEGHKSNIYSIRINNSGLNSLLTDEDLKTTLRDIIEETVMTAVKKIAPATTQLWQIIWSGL